MDYTLKKASRLIECLLIVILILFSVGCVPDEAIYAWFPDGRVEQISPSHGFFYQSCIHPEGNYAICSGNLKGAPRIWKINMVAKEWSALTPEDAASIHGVFSWDGKKIAFASDMGRGRQTPSFDVAEIAVTGTPPPTAKLNIFIMDADGSNIRQLTSGRYQDLRPTFSPDGKSIAFVSGYYNGKKRHSDSPSSTLWIVPTDGNGEPEVIPMDEPAYRPWFSADGKRLYFFMNNSLAFRHQICSVPVEGGEIMPLPADNRGWSHGPFVDPGGAKLLMHSNRDVKWNIYEVSLPDGELALLQPPGFDFINVAHATRAVNGVITFDSFADVLKWIDH